MAGLPSLELAAQIIGANGDSYYWGSGEAAKNRLQGLSLTTKRGEGFSTAQCTLSRRIDLDWSDLRLLDGVVIFGADGTTAYEGRLAGDPRDFQDSPSITPQFVGWMAETKRRKFREIYVDRDLSGWADMPLNEKVRLSGATVDYGVISVNGANDGIAFSIPSQAIPAVTVAQETWYTAPPGVTIAVIQHKGTVTSLPASWTIAVLSMNVDSAGAPASYGPLLDAALHEQILGTACKYVAILVNSNSVAVTPAAGSGCRFQQIALYGNHGLTRRASLTSGDPSGLYASDVLTNIIQRYAPKLTTKGIQQTTLPISQITFKDRTYPYDAIQLLNGPHLWEMNVWENQGFNYYPIDTTDYDWEVRIGEAGVTCTLQGDTTDDLANGVAVEYTDVTTGRLTELTPDSFSQLQATDVENEANRHGDKLWLEISLSFPTTQDIALALGQAALAEFNDPKSPGTITVKGYIRDRAGHWQPGWKVRASDRLIISNHPNSNVRIVGETSWDHDSKTLTIAVDTIFKRLDAVLDRFGTALSAAGLA